MVSLHLPSNPGQWLCWELSGKVFFLNGSGAAVRGAQHSARRGEHGFRNGVKSRGPRNGCWMNPSMEAAGDRTIAYTPGIPRCPREEPPALGKSFCMFVEYLCAVSHWTPSYTPTLPLQSPPFPSTLVPCRPHGPAPYAHPVLRAPGSCDPTHSHRGYRDCHENQLWSESRQLPGDGDRSGTGHVDSPLETLRPDPGTEGVFHLWLQRGEVSLGMLMALVTITARDPDRHTARETRLPPLGALGSTESEASWMSFSSAGVRAGVHTRLPLSLSRLG